MISMSSPRALASRAYTTLPIRSDKKCGGSSFTKATQRTVRFSGRAERRRVISIKAATPLALSSAPGDPQTVSVMGADEQNLLRPFSAEQLHFEIRAYDAVGLIGLPPYGVARARERLLDVARGGR